MVSNSHGLFIVSKPKLGLVLAVRMARIVVSSLALQTHARSLWNSSYIPHIIKEAEIFEFKNRGKKLFTNSRSGDYWSQVCLFSHPSTFDTIAIDLVLKQEIQEDLKKFVNRSEFYNRVGKAWKRGYLLYGPPGTGKTNIDCSIDLSSRLKKSRQEDNEDGDESTNDRSGSGVSLSGVLNFVDGLCYLKIEEHELMNEVENLLCVLEITPADVAECFMKYDEDPDMGMRNVVEELKKRLKMHNNQRDEIVQAKTEKRLPSSNRIRIPSKM
ncbi:hypothetical protein MKW94_007091 [Papaver nudicaule]|uniref:AAA+ ATPase At3g28540-like C-terminal domain-containing protein n=1 Tax=Papaver nudicaule TaxID=74823 RepID=A0AA41RXD4_PAPNU|nr:hypothetical protein [Papaver nudicaule]